MAALDDARLDLLKRELEDKYIHYLPPMLPSNKSPGEIQTKNLSRALSAYALSAACDIQPALAAQSVVDDFDDYGVDAIYMDPATETLYLVQGKLKKGADFTQDEALAFGQGIRKLLEQDLSGFNQHVQNRKHDIEAAVEEAATISTLIVIAGDQLSAHARQAIDEVLTQEALQDERINTTVMLLNGSKLADRLQETKKPEKVNHELYLTSTSKINAGRKAFIGVASLGDLADLHHQFGDTLYDKNIRTFLGTRSEVNESIIRSLDLERRDFFFLNNGITVLCDLIDPRGNAPSGTSGRKFKLRGLSVINGAQTISSAAEFLHTNPNASLQDVKIGITLIQAGTETEFASRVTRARNHQNPIALKDFVALDANQERIRREMSYLNVQYHYKPGERPMGTSGDVHVGEAAKALGLFGADPRVAVSIKKDPAALQDSSSTLYGQLFGSAISAHEVVNAVRFYRYVADRMQQEEEQARNERERLVYRHGVFALGWLLAKRVQQSQRGAKLIDTAKLSTELSRPFDNLRQGLVNHMNTSARADGPLKFFGNASLLLPALEALAIDDFGLGNDPVIPHKRAQHDPQADYPKPLFDYLVSKAPQIGNLT